MCFRPSHFANQECVPAVNVDLLAACSPRFGDRCSISSHGAESGHESAVFSGSADGAHPHAFVE